MASSSLPHRQIMSDTAEQRRKKETGIKLPGRQDKYAKYTPLLKAALKGDWKTASKFFEQDPDAITAPITRELESALYMATGTGPAAIKFVEELLKLMPADAVAKRDIGGNTALHLGAWVGNTKAAVLLVEKNPGLLSIRENQRWLPIHLAAINAKKETISFLLEATEKDDAAMRMLFTSPSRTEPSGAELLIHVITSGFYDLALDLVRRYPQLAISQVANNHDCGLGAIARKVQAFPSGTRFNFWGRIFYAHVPVKLEKYDEDLNRVETENPINDSQSPVQKSHWTRFLGKTFFISGSSQFYLKPYSKIGVDGGPL
ncbi:hypothetical protein Vadar_014328 [Vaccinium darrowii]|uniref:Uncharacterized protein n=1 Tax=Vaccinium darrowii TaxID=229202 RepID=A0ACB7X0R2_9ERIC|nr:hypothetical protein Vadar_014328 [Vaccinium darrowii]